MGQRECLGRGNLDRAWRQLRRKNERAILGRDRNSLSRNPRRRVAKFRLSLHPAGTAGGSDPIARGGQHSLARRKRSSLINPKLDSLSAACIYALSLSSHNVHYGIFRLRLGKITGPQRECPMANVITEQIRSRLADIVAQSVLRAEEQRAADEACPPRGLAARLSLIESRADGTGMLEGTRR